MAFLLSFYPFVG